MNEMRRDYSTSRRSQSLDGEALEKAKQQLMQAQKKSLPRSSTGLTMMSTTRFILSPGALTANSLRWRTCLLAQLCRTLVAVKNSETLVLEPTAGAFKRMPWFETRASLVCFTCMT